MKYSTSSHCEGLKVVPKDRRKEIEEALDAVATPVKKGTVTKLRKQLIEHLYSNGWSHEVQVATGSSMKITSCKTKVGICVQTGNTSRTYADLIKLQTLYLDGAIDSAVIILPSGEAAATFGSNIASSERLERELRIFRKSIHLPLIVYSMRSDV